MFLPVWRNVLGLFTIGSLDLEALAINEDKVALAVQVGSVSQAGDHDVAVGQAMGGVGDGAADIVQLGRLDDRLDLGRPGVGGHIKHVDTAAQESWNNQEVPGSGWIIVATGAGVPSSVMDLVAQEWQMSPMNNLKNI